MLSSVSAFLLLFPAVINGHPAGYHFPLYPEKLECNNVTGMLTERYLNLGRPLQNGDEIIWKGTILANAAVVRFDVYRAAPPAVAIHIRQDFGSIHSAFTEWPAGAWIQELLVGNTFEIRKNGQHVFTYIVRYPTSIADINQIDQYGHFVVTSIEMKCANPPRKPDDHSHEHGPRNHSLEHHHSHEHHHSLEHHDSSDSSSDESLDESC